MKLSGLYTFLNYLSFMETDCEGDSYCQSCKIIFTINVSCRKVWICELKVIRFGGILSAVYLYLLFGLLRKSIDKFKTTTREEIVNAYRIARHNEIYR